MAEREGSCSCGQLQIRVASDPLKTGVCHCLACQQRSGSAFAVQARFAADSVRTEGRASEYVRISDEGEPRSSYFCPQCGVTVWVHAPIGPRHDPDPGRRIRRPSVPGAERLWMGRA
jgi:hypothetical protein